MRIVKTMRISNLRNLLAPFHGLPPTNKDLVQMAVEGINVAHTSALAIRVPHDDYVSPALMAIPRKNNDSIANGIDRVTEVGVTTADTVPIFTLVSMRSIAARFVVAARLPFSDGKIE